MTGAATLPACRCGHEQESHTALAPQCDAARCECLRYRPADTQVASAPTPRPPLKAAPAEQPTFEQLLAAVNAAAATGGVIPGEGPPA